MALYLDEDEQIPVPPSGKRALVIDPADGALKQVDSDGAQTAVAAVEADATIGGDGTADDPLSLAVTVAPNSTWARAQWALIKSVVPQLTDYQYLKAGNVPQGATSIATNDGAAEGGGRTAANATFTYLTASVFQTSKTGRGAIAFRAKFAAPGISTNAVGVANNGGGHDLLVGAIHSISDANYSMSADGTASTADDLGVALDSLFHTFVVTWDTANIKVYLDGTLRATRVIGTNMVDEARYLAIYNGTSGNTVWTEALYAYIAP